MMVAGSNLMPEAVVEEQPEEEKKAEQVSPDINLPVIINRFVSIKYKYMYKYKYKYLQNVSRQSQL